jgi:hypothetical protein
MTDAQPLSELRDWRVSDRRVVARQWCRRSASEPHEIALLRIVLTGDPRVEMDGRLQRDGPLNATQLHDRFDLGRDGGRELLTLSDRQAHGVNFRRLLDRGRRNGVGRYRWSAGAKHFLRLGIRGLADRCRHGAGSQTQGLAEKLAPRSWRRVRRGQCRGRVLLWYGSSQFDQKGRCRV